MAQQQDNSKNIIVGPDYGQMIKQHTNGAIVEAFISTLFSKNTKFNFKTILGLIRNMAILVAVKTILEDSKTYLDTFKITDLNLFKYYYQSICNSRLTYDIILAGGKWKHNNLTISINNLTYFLEQKHIYISQPGTYYYSFKNYLIKVTISATKITFIIPDIEFMKQYVENDIISKNKEILFGNKTTMTKVNITNSNVIKFDPMELSHAFETDNYKKLKESIDNYFFIDRVLKLSKVPLCVNFDGKPGTGKTTFGSYIAETGIFDRIILCNTVQASNLSFFDIMTTIERQLTNNSPKDKKLDDNPEIILLIIDELDKWLESYTSKQINKFRDEARKKKTSAENNKGENVVIECYEKLSVEEENDKKQYIKAEFLDQLYKLIEGNMFTDARKYVIIFNTNHFSRLFDGVDKRFDALSDRFTKYKFKRIGKKDIIKYFDSFRTKLINFEKSKENETNDKLISRSDFDRAKIFYNYDLDIYHKIPDDCKITYRSLEKLLRSHKFNVEKTINCLSNKEVIKKDSTENLNSETILFNDK